MNREKIQLEISAIIRMRKNDRRSFKNKFDEGLYHEIQQKINNYFGSAFKTNFELWPKRHIEIITDPGISDTNGFRSLTY